MCIIRLLSVKSVVCACPGHKCIVGIGCSRPSVTTSIFHNCEFFIIIYCYCCCIFCYHLCQIITLKVYTNMLCCHWTHNNIKFILVNRLWILNHSHSTHIRSIPTLFIISNNLALHMFRW